MVRRHAGARQGYLIVKRIGDVVVTGAALVLLSPVLLATALVVRVGLGSPVLFRQERPGRGGETFVLLKFRTLRDVDPARGLVSDEQRITPLGARLRASSLDELPSLLNVLRGEMSLVGPRPLRTRYLERYSAEQARRHDVRPGLTGAAQVAGRNALSWDDRFALDLEYVRTCGVATDLRILLATVPKVLGREGIAEEGRVTMSDFFGPRRIGGDVIREAGGGPEGAAWWVVGREGGELRARAHLALDGEGVAGIDLEVEAGVEEPARVRARGVEMLLGIAREQGARRVRLPSRPGDEVLAARLGLRREPVPAGGPGSVLVRDLPEVRG
ncbi:sugar transferase [Brachybacterium sp. YJGR34]|uniref:sugar transferase n=1 Tax=Brachybacterium sp. YJGR34 TaxID=2059911 RepID=UPI000E0B9512|nr:sugar transferase [Brachybacterium sp. YJGR34]